MNGRVTGFKNANVPELTQGSTQGWTCVLM